MESPVVTGEGYPSNSDVVSRVLPAGTLVYAAGTIWWPRALGNRAAFHDGRVERITLNVLERALAHRRPRQDLPALSDSKPGANAPVPVWAKNVAAFAGSPGNPGFADGPAEAARFSGPAGLAADKQGNLYVADTRNNRIRMITGGSPRVVKTIAGNGDSGFRDGPGGDAMFRWPTDVAVGGDGALYVADSDNHVIRRLDRDQSGNWQVHTLAGKGHTSGFADGPPGSARFNRPTSLDLDAGGNIYVADQANNRIRMIQSGSGNVVTLAGSGAGGSQDATTGIWAQFLDPSAVAVATNGMVYVLDTGNQLIRRLAPTPGWPVTTLAGKFEDSFGYSDGSGDRAQFLAQMGLAATNDGAVIISDTANFRIRELVPGADPASTKVYTLAGSGRIGTNLGSGKDADIVAPTGLAVGPNQKIYVSDSQQNVIREITR
jgi:sugar lactone lactonase YvrE